MGWMDGFRPRAWNQGKAAIANHQSPIILPPRAWIEIQMAAFWRQPLRIGKTGVMGGMGWMDSAPVFGIKAKQSNRQSPIVNILPPPCLE